MRKPLIIPAFLFIFLTSCGMLPGWFLNMSGGLAGTGGSGSASSGAGSTSSVTALSDGIYVRVDGLDTNTGMDKNFPVKTIGVGIINAINYGKQNIYVASGNYTYGNGLGTTSSTGEGEGVSISSASNLYITGGWDSGFMTKKADDKSVLDGQLHFRIMTINNSFNVNIDGFIFSNGASSTFGGGIYLTSCSNIEVDSCDIVSNASISRGGGICVQGSGLVTFKNINVLYNTSSYGGGIYLDTSGNCQIDGYFGFNSAGQTGGGVDIDTGCIGTILTGRVENNMLLNGMTIMSGGGVYVAGTNTSMLGMAVINNSISCTSGGVFNGGGIYFGYGNYCLISNCVITGNSVSNVSGNTCNGGGIAVVDGSNAIIIDNIITNDWCCSQDYYNSVLSIQQSTSYLLDGLVIFGNRIGGNTAETALSAYGICDLIGSSIISSYTLTNNIFVTNRLSYLYYGGASHMETPAVNVYILNSNAYSNYQSSTSCGGNDVTRD